MNDQSEGDAYIRAVHRFIVNTRKTRINLDDVLHARPGGIIRYEGEPPLTYASCVPVPDASGWEERQPSVTNCVNCGAPADEAVCSYCGTRHR